MAGASQRRPFESAAARHRMAVRRRKYLRRRVVLLLILVALATGIYYGLHRWRDRPQTPTPPPTNVVNAPPLPFRPATFLKVTLDGEQEAYLAMSAPANSLLQMAVVVGPQKAPKLVGQPVTVPAFDVAVVDLPRAKGVVVLYQKLPTEGTPKVVNVGNVQVAEANGGEPDYQAWQVDKTKGLIPADYYRLAAPGTPPAPTAIVVDKWLNVLWFYDKGELVQTYRVATGIQPDAPAPTAPTAMANKATPLGTFTIGTKVPGMPYYKENIPAGDPKNPLGTRWLGFSVYPGDNAAVWAIHGTNQPSSVGHWVSDGCIRLANPAVEWLYDHVEKDTMLQIVSSKPKS